MSVTLEILGLQIAWWSAAAAYLASERQLLLQKPLPKPLGWAAFVLGAALCVAALTAVHDGLTAVVYWLCAVMVAWVLLVLAVPHVSRKPYTLLWGTALMLIAAVLG